MEKMIAWVSPKAGAKLERVERDIPKPGPKEILIRVHACGVCHSDTSTVEGYFPGIQYPRIPGHEVIGTVLEIGSEVQGWKVGERAGTGWFGGSCGYCTNCRSGNQFACTNIRAAATGVTRDGGYATHMLADVSAVAHVPDGLDEIESSPLLCAGLTTFNALRHAGAGPGDLVAVLGVGGLGHLAIQYAAKQGFRTVAINRGTDKKDLAMSLGAHDYIDSAAENPAEALLKLGGAKAILATASNADAMKAVLTGLSPNGILMVLGVVAGFDINTFDMLAKRSTVRAWYSGVPLDAEDTLAFSKVSPMNEIYPFDKAQEAYDRMMSGKATFRVVLKMPDRIDVVAPH
jgi:alcohol dehydrogenase